MHIVHLYVLCIRMKSSNRNILLFAIVVAVLVNMLSWNFPFFWDTILTSTITHSIFEHGGLLPPPSIDAGHPPLFYWYIVLMYQLFGYSLQVAHLAMLPFTIIGALTFILLLQRFQFSKQQQYFAVLFYFSIPAVFTQHTMLSYDVVLLSMYCAALAVFLYKRKILLSLISIVLVGVSLRGIVCLFAISMTIFFFEKRKFKLWWHWNLYFIPALILSFIWYYFHYTQTGWWISTPSIAWSQHRSFVDAKGFAVNLFSIARCFFDVGIFILSLLTALYFIKVKKLDKLMMIWCIPALIFILFFIPFSNPINHRYFLIVYVFLLLPVLKFLSDKKVYVQFIFLFIVILGHFQIYPVPISNAWDCTMQYANYSSVKQEAENFITSKNINRDAIATVFPMNASFLQTNNKVGYARLENIHAHAIDSIPYILFSNVGNDFSDTQIKQLQQWHQIASFDKGLIHMILYKNPVFSNY